MYKEKEINFVFEEKNYSVLVGTRTGRENKKIQRVLASNDKIKLSSKNEQVIETTSEQIEKAQSLSLGFAVKKISSEFFDLETKLKGLDYKNPTDWDKIEAVKINLGEYMEAMLDQSTINDIFDAVDECNSISEVVQKK